MALIATSDLLTLKKAIYVANLSEDEVNTPEQSRHYMGVKESGLDHQEGHQGPQAAFEANHNFYVRIHSICFLLVLYRQFNSALDVQSHYFVGIALYISLYMFIFNPKFCY